VGVTARSIISAVLVLVLVTALLLVLSLAKFETLLGGMVLGRLNVVAISIRDAVQGAVDLGIPLAEVRTADALIWRALNADPDIASIDISDAAGQVLFSSNGQDAAEAPTPHPGPVARGQPARLGTSVAITNSFGETIGTVRVSYDGAVLDAQRQMLLRALLQHLGLVVLVGSALAAMGFNLVMRRASRVTAHLHRLLGAGAAAAPPPGADGLAEALHGAKRHALAIEQEITGLEAAEPPAPSPASPVR
jgi:hypothetical protein